MKKYISVNEVMVHTTVGLCRQLFISVLNFSNNISMVMMVTVALMMGGDGGAVAE